MSQDSSFVEIIVIDDVQRFPFHLWHYLARSTGFGIGDISARAEPSRSRRDSPTTWHRFWNESKPQGLETPAGDARVWWVDASRRKWKKSLRKVLKKLPVVCEKRFVIDFRGPDPSSGGSYSVKKAMKTLIKNDVIGPKDDSLIRKIRETVFVVSSYETMPCPAYGVSTSEFLQVYSKSTETFARIEKSFRKEVLRVATERLKDPRNHESADSRSGLAATPKRVQVAPILHVLVTGAGSEMEDTTFGSSCALGLPDTGQVLEHVLGDLGLDPKLPTLGDRAFQPFPVPRRYLHTKQGERLKQRALKRDLDVYWNELLRLESELNLGENDAGTLASRKLRIAEHESHLRDAFRNRLRSKDWGHLPQLIHAAGLSWDVWLSTNYTRFADRALNTFRIWYNEHEWNVISTSSEASRLLRSLLHEGLGGTPPAEEEPREESEAFQRYLFKLHGDIAHLTTMAIAGHDKELFTPFSFPVDSLHHVYLAAYNYLRRRIRRWVDYSGGRGKRRGRSRKEKKYVVWHIVGHSLFDRLLVNIIAGLSSEPGVEHLYLLVAPTFPRKKSARDRIARAVNLRADSEAIVKIELSAAEYLARVHQRKLLEKNLRSGSDWRTGLGLK